MTWFHMRSHRNASPNLCRFAGARSSRSPAARYRPELLPLEERVLLTVNLGTNFTGLNTVDAGGIIEPPDTIAAAGPNHVVEVVNSNLAVYDKATGNRVLTEGLDAFFAPVDSIQSLFSDVYVTYDEQVGRFFVSTMDIDFFGFTSYFDFAISNDSNPLHGFTEMHQIETDEISSRTGENLFTDFPRVGWNADAYVVTFNMFGFQTEQQYNTETLVISKSSVTDQNNSTLTEHHGIDRPLPNSTMVPATMHGSVSGDPMWLVEEKGLEQSGNYTMLRIVKMTNVLSATPTFTDFYVTVDPYTITPFPNDPLGTVTMAIDTRILSADWRSGMLVASQNVGVDADTVVHARWYELSTSGSAPSLLQQGTYTPASGAHTYYPSVAIAPDGSIGMTFMESGDTENMSMYVIGRTAGDATGTLEAAVLAKAGEEGYMGTRAGDFSGISLDPATGTSFWAVNEYANIADPSFPNWGTWIANFSIGSGLHFGVTLPASVTAGSPFDMTVTALNVNGTTNTGYRGTVHFTSTDSLATLPGSYTFTATDNGVHTFTNGVTLDTAGGQTVTAIDTSSVTGIGSTTVNAAAASRLVVAGFPTPTTAGDAHNFTVTAKDPFGNVATGYTGTVHFTSTDSKASLPANYTFTSGDGGVRTFSATLKTAGTRSITATDTVTSTITGTQSGIKVNVAAVSVLAVTGFPATTTAGVVHSVTVTAKDAYGNKVTSYRGTIHFTSSDPQAVLPGNYTFTSTDNGAHTFTNSVTLKTAGTQSITATDTSNSSLTGTEGNIKVNPAAIASFQVSGFPTPISAGTPGNFTVRAQDTFGNTVSSYRGRVHFTSSDSAATLPNDYTFTASDAGSHPFTATLRTVGTQSLTATDNANSSITGSQTGISVTTMPGGSLRPGGSPGQAPEFGIAVWLRDYANTSSGLGRSREIGLPAIALLAAKALPTEPPSLRHRRIAIAELLAADGWA